MKNKRIILAVSLTMFFLLAVVYFMPTSVLKAALPAMVVKYRIIGPLFVLTVASICLKLPWQMVLAMGFSCAGDFMGAHGCFLGQMGFFALAHAMFICWFIKLLDIKSLQTFFQSNVRRVCAAMLVFITLTVFAGSNIIPHAPQGLVRTGCALYAFLICAMLGLAMLLKRPLIAIGAALFLFSDLILSWNKFVSPIDASKWLIMVPYYSGQLLIWLGAYRESSKN